MARTGLLALVFLVGLYSVVAAIRPAMPGMSLAYFLHLPSRENRMVVGMVGVTALVMAIWLAVR
jgi:type II secretory pathway component PulM